MPYKNKASRTAKDAKKKPKLQWRVEIVIAEPVNPSSANLVTRLQELLQDLTDTKWRVFSVNVDRDGDFVVSAYLSSWNAEGENSNVETDDA